VGAELETHSGTSDRLKIVEVGNAISGADGLMNYLNMYAGVVAVNFFQYTVHVSLIKVRHTLCKYSTLKQTNGSLRLGRPVL